MESLGGLGLVVLNFFCAVVLSAEISTHCWHCSSVPATTPAQKTLNPGQDLQLFSSCACYLLKSPAGQ